VDWFLWRAVSAEVDDQALPAVADLQADEVVLVNRSTMRPASVAGCVFERSGGDSDSGFGRVKDE
jgi:hypothetical protein